VENGKSRSVECFRSEGPDGFRGCLFGVGRSGKCWLIDGFAWVVGGAAGVKRFKSERCMALVTQVLDYLWITFAEALRCRREFCRSKKVLWATQLDFFLFSSLYFFYSTL
jgi:hypothetical protein